MPRATVQFDVQLTDHPLLFDAAVQVVDADGSITMWVHAPQFDEDPRGVIAEMREHLRANSLACRHGVLRLVRPRPGSSLDGVGRVATVAAVLPLTGLAALVAWVTQAASPVIGA